MNKKKIIIASVVLAVLIGLLVTIFCLTNKNNKDNDKKNNYSLDFVYYSNNKASQKISFVYKDKELKDIIATVYFNSKTEAQTFFKEYKANKEFKEYELDGKKILLYYKDSDVKPYKTYTQDEIIQEYTSRGYTYKK